MACDKNIRVKYYVGDKYKLRENGKLRPILERLRNHSRVITVSERPVVLKWDNEHELVDNKLAHVSYVLHVMYVMKKILVF